MSYKGYDFQEKVIKKFNQKGIKVGKREWEWIVNCTTKTFDLDMFSYVFKYVKCGKKYDVISKLMLVGEIKSLNKNKITFQDFKITNPELKKENISLLLPTFSGDFNKLTNFLGGNIMLSEYEKMGINLTISKEVTIDKEGNKHLYLISKKLLQAVEYFHKKESLINQDILYINAIIPLIVVNSEIYSRSEDRNTKKTNFTYLVKYDTPTEIEMSIRNYFHVPILICNYRGIDEVINIIFKIKEIFKQDICKL